MSHIATRDELLSILTRYEGAVNECESAGNDSDEAVKELEAARAALMNILKQAKVTVEEKVSEAAQPDNGGLDNPVGPFFTYN